ncbi:MAG: glycosyltransferase family 2 protein [Bdellovibrionales bacterium]|nr:glycosyltransferase family 2 protein [Bdellovibrionales bacterium]
MSDGSVQLSIVVPTHHRKDDLLRLLASVNHQKIDRSLFEVVVVSNEVDSDLRQCLGESKELNFQIRYFEVGSIGVNLARNLGLDKARGSIVYFLDDDCVLLDARTLLTILELHNSFPEVGAFGGKYVIDESAGFLDLVYQWIQDLWMESGFLKDQQTCFLIGGNTSYNRKVLGENLFFDESIIYGGSETELNLRLVKQGYILQYSDELQVLHQARNSFWGLFGKAFKQGRSAQNRREQALLPPKNRRRTMSRELIAFKLVPGLSFLERVCFFWILSLFDHFFKKGLELQERQPDFEFSKKEMFKIFLSAPHIFWIKSLFKLYIFEQTSALKQGHQNASFRKLKKDLET